MLNWDFLILILKTYGLITLMMTGVYLLGRKINNAGVVDVFWPLGFGIIGLFYFLNTPHIAINRKAIVLVLIIAISLRLFFHILNRFLKEYPKEDPRYTKFKEQWGKNANWMMLMAYYLQGTLMTILSSVYAFIFLNPAPLLSILEFIGIFTILIAFYGQTVSDAQLRRFKTDPNNKGKTCQVGLWHYSRHPNYFFEWLIWIGYLVIALGQGLNGLVFIICPLIMLHFLINVTGVAATEAHALTSRSDYAQYQKTTSMFVPWFKRKITD